MAGPVACTPGARGNLGRVIGVIAQAVGIVPPKAMEKGNSFGLGMVIIIIVVLGTVIGGIVVSMYLPIFKLGQVV